MSNNILKIIPEDPYFFPSPEAVESASGELARYLSKRKEDIQVVSTEAVRFVDPGSHLRDIRCPFCGRMLDFEWWQAVMDKADAEKFRSLTTATPCCHNVTSLNNLIYDWAAGFARMSIEVRDPNGDITQEQHTALERLLGTKIRKVLSHY
jgi:hypothetical protein